MKRTLTTTIVALLLCICMVFGLTACTSQEDIDNAVNSATAPLNGQITALEADIADKTAKIATLEGEKTALTTEKGELEADVTALEAEKAALEADKAELEADLATLEAEKKALSDENAALEASITAKNAEIATLNSSVASLEAEKTTLNGRVTELNAQITTLNERIAELEESGEADGTEITELKAKVATLESEKATLTTRVTELEGTITEKNATIADLEADVEDLTSAKADLEAQITTLNGTITEKNNEIATLNSSISALNTEKATLTAQVSELEASIAEKDTQIASLTAEKQALTDRVAELEDKNEALEEEKSELEEKIEALKNCVKGNHSYLYNANGDGTHDKICSVCGDTVNEDHTPNETIGQICNGYKCALCDAWYGEAAEHGAMDPTTGLCSKGCGTNLAAAKVGTIYYSDFATATKNWTDGTTLTLYIDVEGTGTITLSNKSVALDLNGHTYSYSNRLFLIDAGAELTVTDSSAGQTGSLQCTVNTVAIIVIGTLNIAGGKITSDARNYEIVACDDGGAVNISGGVVEHSGGDAVSLDLQYGSICNITGGRIRSIIIFDVELRVGGDADIDLVGYCGGVIDLRAATNIDGLKIIISADYTLEVGTNLILPEGMELQVDTIPVEMLGAFQSGTVSHPHTGGTATCVKQAICDICENPYGRTIEHIIVGEFCSGCGQKATISVTNGSDTYYALEAVSLNAAVADMLRGGETTFTVNLPANAEVKLFTAIRRAIIDADVPDGSIHLTLAGVTAIPDHDEWNLATAIFGAVNGDFNERVDQLASISLPDVVTIGNSAFKSCWKLTSLYAPKVQAVGEYAFAYTNLTSVELPKATTIDRHAFMSCTSLIAVKLPSATSIGDQAFLASEKITYLELTAEGAITLGTSVFNVPSQNFSTSVNLVLHGNKSDEVNGLTWNGYTFKSITFVE